MCSLVILVENISYNGVIILMVMVVIGYVDVFIVRCCGVINM